MKEAAPYNSYYSDFHEFRTSIFKFPHLLNNLDPGSDLERRLRSRIRDKVRAIGAPKAI